AWPARTGLHSRSGLSASASWLRDCTLPATRAEFRRPLAVGVRIPPLLLQDDRPAVRAPNVLSIMLLGLRVGHAPTVPGTVRCKASPWCHHGARPDSGGTTSTAPPATSAT